ncbi:hypothetical protein B0T14DRAFT_563136 [Immersiella caudata]|uniref:Uncharacterized protein n=1 Tax=Immersiella caudata TaxID=314043 RepID=A0AA40C6Z8_9PEZI|nr:hypothetical protein B0T14DRAFT_563136 [Immersiella caudata]
MSTVNKPPAKSGPAKARLYTPETMKFFEQRKIEGYDAYSKAVNLEKTIQERDAAISALQAMTKKLDDAEKRATKAEARLRAWEKEMQSNIEEAIEDSEARVTHPEGKLWTSDKNLEYLKEVLLRVEQDEVKEEPEEKKRRMM